MHWPREKLFKLTFALKWPQTVYGFQIMQTTYISLSVIIAIRSSLQMPISVVPVQESKGPLRVLGLHRICRLQFLIPSLIGLFKAKKCFVRFLWSCRHSNCFRIRIPVARRPSRLTWEEEEQVGDRDTQSAGLNWCCYSYCRSRAAPVALTDAYNRIHKTMPVRPQSHVTRAKMTNAAVYLDIARDACY